MLLGVYDLENDPMTVSSFTQPAHGKAILNRDGTFTYTPAAGYMGADDFGFTLSDGRGGLSKNTVEIRVIEPTGKWSTTSFVDLAEVQAGNEPIRFGNSATVPRACDWDGDGKIDLLVGAESGVWLYRNSGTATAPRFDAGAKVQAGGQDIQLPGGRVAIALADMDRDGKEDLVAIAAGDRKVRLYRNAAEKDNPFVLAAEEILQGSDGQEFVAEDIRVEAADFNGDGLPDIVTGSRSGKVKIARNVGTAVRAGV